MHFTSRGREYVIEKRLPDRTIRIKDVLTDERTAMPEQELVDSVFGSGAELLGNNRNQDVLKERLKKTGVSDIGSLKEDDPRRVELERRLSYVKAVLAARLEKRTVGVTEKVTIVPVLYATVPVPATCKSLVTALLTAIGDPAAERGSQISQTLRLKRYMEACKVELLILDEFQHFQDRDSLKVLKTVSDWLKVLMDETGVPIVLAGLPYSHTILDAENNEQLRRRFALRIELESFCFNTSRERQDFRRFLNIIDEKLPLAEKSDLADPGTALCIYEATDGVVAHVMKLVRRATVIGLESNRENLTVEILSLAYEQRLAANNPGKPNPFGEIALVA